MYNDRRNRTYLLGRDFFLGWRGVAGTAARCLPVRVERLRGVWESAGPGATAGAVAACSVPAPAGGSGTSVPGGAASGRTASSDTVESLSAWEVLVAMAATVPWPGDGAASSREGPGTPAEEAAREVGGDLLDVLRPIAWALFGDLLALPAGGCLAALRSLRLRRSGLHDCFCS